MIAKDDWRLVAGPVLGNEEKFKKHPSVSHPLPAAFRTVGS